MNSTDKKILDGIRHGNDDKALSQLYDKPLKKIRQYVLKNNGNLDDANDIFQDAVIILFKQVHSNKYDENHDITGFLYSVARNLWISKVKREKRIVLKEMGEESNLSDHNNSLADLIGREKSEALRKVFEQLNENCRKLLHYAIYEKLSMKEISVKMGFSNENVAKSNHYRCKSYLAALVKENETIYNLLKN